MTPERHDWEQVSEGWPIYRCVRCGYTNGPRTMLELRSPEPEWFRAPCPGPRIISKDDLDWLRGGGRFAQ